MQATVSRIDRIIGLLCRILFLLYGSFAKETYNLIETEYKPRLVFNKSCLRPCKTSCSTNVHLSKVTKVFVGRDYSQMVRLLIFSGTKYSQPCFPYSRKCILSRLWILPAGYSRVCEQRQNTRHDLFCSRKNRIKDTTCCKSKDIKSQHGVL